MSNDNAKTLKRPFRSEIPFPWRCANCGKNEVSLTTVEHEGEVKHDSNLYTVTVPALEIPVCQACGEKVFTEMVDAQINAALHSELHLLTPEEIRTALDRLAMTQKEVAEHLGIAEVTLSRWLNETQIQSRAMDNLMRVFFEFPSVRNALGKHSANLALGTRELTSTTSESDVTVS